MNLTTTVNLCILFILHFVADFLLQSREMGKKKSEKLSWLLAHFFIIYGVINVGGKILLLGTLSSFQLFVLSLANAIIHGVIDWNIWKLYKLYVFKKLSVGIKDFKTAKRVAMDKAKVYKYWEDHWFYATIGTDQLLHTITLIGVYYAIQQIPS